ncbi:MAG TPA: zinc ABC transporter solute-binding protein [Bacilli bacterium]|nr:zinc ABC transporter solute-binding protein [Bacilli bacterium]
MRNKLALLLVAVLVAMSLVACSNGEKKEEVINKEGENSEKLQVVTSFTIIEDMAKEIGGDLVDVYNLVPTGTDPHEYSPLPNDIKAATDADVLFYNGLNLEGGEHGWFAKMIDATSQDWAVTYELAEDIEPMFITSEDGKEEEINPHAFLDPVVGIEMTKKVRDAFIEVDPDNEATYEENAEIYLEKLIEIHEQYQTFIEKIPEENRTLVTSERAYQYLAARYGLREGYIWAIDTEENGSPEQIKSLLTFLEETSPPVLFIETNVDKRPMETISRESGIEIFGEIFSDEIGNPGEEGDTYLKYLQYNIDVIYQGLKGK